MVNAFLLVSSSGSAYEMAGFLARLPWIRWCRCVYGPHPVVAYAQAANHRDLSQEIEGLRDHDDVVALDARMCKEIPGDEHLDAFHVRGVEAAVLLINVDYTLERERDLTYKLRAMERIPLARAMWGPADIVVLIEADSHEDMRNAICDEIKTMRGVKSNTTLYCYPEQHEYTA